MPRMVIRPDGEKKVRLYKRPLRKLVSDPIEIGQEAREGVDYGKAKNEKGEVLEYPSHWKMKELAGHVTTTINDFDNLIEFFRLGLSDFHELDFTLEWIFETFNDVERHRAYYLKDNTDKANEKILDEGLKELRVMFEEARAFYRRRAFVERKFGGKIVIKF